MFYGVFVHTNSMGQKDVFGHIHVGFPDTDFNDWLEDPIDFQDIIDLQQQLFQEKEDLHAQIQQPVPVFKKGANEQAGEDAS